MNISDFVRANSASGYLSASSTKATSTASRASGQGLQKAEQRIQAQVDATTAQLSSFGKLKSAVSDTQLSARSLGSLPTTAKPDAVKTALGSFVTAFNTALGSALGAAKTLSAPGGDTTASQSATRLNKDLQRSTATDATALATRTKIGVTTGADGKLAIDANKLGAALTANPTEVRETLAKLGRQVEQAATKELATDGDVGGPLSTLNQRSSVLKSQQATLATLASQTAASAQPKPNNSLFGYGVSAYQNGIF